ncbi:unnamed protein product [Ixodes pacificus]
MCRQPEHVYLPCALHRIDYAVSTSAKDGLSAGLMKTTVQFAINGKAPRAAA